MNPSSFKEESMEEVELGGPSEEIKSGGPPIVKKTSFQSFQVLSLIFSVSIVK